jgi:hypothetical protein
MGHWTVRTINMLCYFAGIWMLSQQFLASALVAATSLLLSYFGYGWQMVQNVGIIILMLGFARYFAIFKF